MSLFSFSFFVFLCVGVLVYYLLPGRWQWVCLLVLSGGFYACAGPAGLLFPAVTIVTTWLGGLAMARVENMPGGTWYGHQGRMKGLSSNIYFQPDTGLSIAVIANGYEAQSVDGVVSIARVFMEKAQELLP